MRYNQATFVIGVLADSVFPKIFSGNEFKFREKLLLSLFTELQKERVGSLVQDGAFLTLRDSQRAFNNQRWIDEQNLSKVMEIGSNIFAQELLNYGVDRTIVNQLVLGRKLNFWVTTAETFAQGSNVFLQWLDWERSRKWEQQNGQPFGISNTLVQSQRNTTNSSNSNLVTAVRNAVGSNLSDLFDRIEYFSAEVDLNNDRNKEVIVYTAGPQCGAWECPVYIFKRSGNKYHLIGTTSAASNEAQIAVLKSRSNGWLDIATLAYNSQQRRANWKLHKFNGSVYQNTYQNLSSKPTQIILRPNRGSGVNLAKSGVTSSVRSVQVQRNTSNQPSPALPL